MKVKVLLIKTLIAGVFALSVGCASLVYGTKQTIFLNSQPPGAVVSINGSIAGKTPTEWVAPRNKNIDVVLELEGYATHHAVFTRRFNVATVGNLLFGPLWIVGFGVDVIGGSIFSFEPGTINPVLVATVDGLPVSSKVESTETTKKDSSFAQNKKAGMKASRRFNIANHPSHLHKDTTIAVLKFDPGEELSVKEAGMLSDRFAVELDQVGVYKITSQSKMKEVLELQKFSSDCGTVSCAIEAGQMLGVQYMVYGSVGKFGSMYTLNVHMVDIELGTIIAGVSVDHEGRLEDLLSESMGEAVDKLMVAVSEKLSEETQP